MTGEQQTTASPSPMVRNYAEEVVVAYLGAVDDSPRAREVAELYDSDAVIEAAARIIDSNDTDWRV